MEHPQFCPEGYAPGNAPGKTKYVVVVGTVMSGLGKGIFAGSLARVLQDDGFSVAPIKLEGYLNMDAGTLNPVRHGEVFVLDDGTECDMDLGNYERLLDLDLGRLNFVTSGQVLASVLERERSGGYLGSDVQVIPHVTGEIKLRLRTLAAASGADIVFVEIGGTVGDLENGTYIEACRQLASEERGSVLFVALTYVPAPSTLGEQKSKPAQLGLRQLMSLGVMPNLIVARSAKPISRTVREKLSLYGGVAEDRVFGMHDMPSTGLVPDMVRAEGIHAVVLDGLGFPASAGARSGGGDAYAAALRMAAASGRTATVGIAGKYTALRDAYASVVHALEHAAVELGVGLRVEWIDTEEIDDDNAAAAMSKSGASGLVVPGGFGLRGVAGKLACIRHARSSMTPFLGLCYGFQLAVIEFARNRCGLPGATSGEIDPESGCKPIDVLPGQSGRMGGTMRLGGHDIALRPRTLAASLYLGAPTCRQRFRHRHELVAEYVGALEAGGMEFSGEATDGSLAKQILEIPGHPFFLATQGHPELSSRPARPEPMFRGFLEAVASAAG